MQHSLHHIILDYLKFVFAGQNQTEICCKLVSNTNRGALLQELTTTKPNLRLCSTQTLNYIRFTPGARFSLFGREGNLI